MPAEACKQSPLTGAHLWEVVTEKTKEKRRVVAVERVQCHFCGRRARPEVEEATLAEAERLREYQQQRGKLKAMSQEFAKFGKKAR